MRSFISALKICRGVLHVGWEAPFLTLRINMRITLFLLVGLFVIYLGLYELIASGIWLKIKEYIHFVRAHFLDLVCGSVFLVFSCGIIEKEYRALKSYFAIFRHKKSAM